MEIEIAIKKDVKMEILEIQSSPRKSIFSFCCYILVSAEYQKTELSYIIIHKLISILASLRLFWNNS
jgi:hypothetical protein